MTTATANSISNTDDFESISALLNNNKSYGKCITKSFRLYEDIVNKLGQQARNNNVSLNAEINNILRKYVEWDMLANKVGMIPIARPIVSEIFQKIMTKEQVIDLANNVAKNVICESVHFMKGNLTLESFLSWIKTRMEQCSNLNYSIDSNSHQVKIIFKHDLGENWSLYHKLIVEQVLDKILAIKNLEIGASSTTLLISFRSPV